MNGRLEGRRVLVTSAERHIGPWVVELFQREGAHVIADESDYTEPGAIEEVVDRAGQIDVLIPHFAGPTRIMPFTNLLGPVTEFRDEDFQGYLDEMVWPMVRIVRTALPQMIGRRSGKIVAVTSASPLRAIPGLAIYTAARAAQNAFIMVAGTEAAEHNVQFNGIGPYGLESVTYFTDEMLEDPSVREQIEAGIPAGVIGQASDAAELVLALATDASNFLVGKVIPITGGW